jgi:hypothetical protein
VEQTSTPMERAAVILKRCRSVARLTDRHWL